MDENPFKIANSVYFHNYCVNAKHPGRVDLLVKNRFACFEGLAGTDQPEKVLV